MVPTGNYIKDAHSSIKYSEAALSVYKKESDTINWAEGQFNLGHAYGLLALYGRDDIVINLQEAIYHYNLVLDIATESTAPLEWATIMNNLGAAHITLYSEKLRSQASQSPYHHQDIIIYPEQINGECFDQDLHEAIGCLRAALRVRTEKQYPEQWAGTLFVLGQAYLLLPCGKTEKNQDIAISCYKKAIHGYEKVGDKKKLSMVKETLATVQSSIN